MIPIIIEPHNPCWAADFEAEKAKLECTLANLPIITIEHVGSTSIPDLIAKPIIDIDIEIKEGDWEPVEAALKAAGKNK